MRPILGALALVLGLTGVAGAAGSGGTAIARLLQDGYEIKSAFYDNQGGAYVLLQKQTSAYMCHSTNSQACDKLN